MATDDGGQTTTTDPWLGAQEGLAVGVIEAQNLFEQQMQDFTPYSDQLYATQTPTMQQAQEMQLGLAAGIPGQVDPITQYGQDLISGQYLDPASNPYLTDYIQTAIDPLTQSLMQEVLPGIRSEAIAAGGYGGSRQGLAEAGAVDAYLQQASDITTQMAAETYALERGYQQAAPETIGAALQLDLLAPTLTAEVGAAQQAEEQALLDETYALWQMQQEQPWMPLEQFMGIMVPAGGMGTMTTEPGTGTNPIGGALGGAAIGAELGSVVPGLGTAWGAGIGGVAGALASY